MFFKLCTGLALAALAASAQAAKVGVSWGSFQEERWKTDEAAIKAQLAKDGHSYLSADAAGSPEKQLADIDSLIAKGAQVLIVLCWDKDAVLPAVRRAQLRKIPVIAYDRLVEAPGVFYITSALAAKGLKGIPLSGRDGEQAALNRVALGQQTVSVWKDSRALGQTAAEVASALAAGKPVPGALKWDGGARKVVMDALLLTPVPITKANLDLVVKAGWIKKEDLCRNVPAAGAPGACK